MIVNIDENSGFCFGVVNAIKKAEEELDKTGFLYCLGDIVHNNAEVGRLKNKGLQIIDYDQFKKLKNCKVLIRAHGEPPDTYEIAKKNNIHLIDASCKVVLKLQNRISNSFKNMDKGGQLVIFGKEGHAEVNGLVGQTNNKAIIVRKSEDLNKIDFSKPVSLFSQTTMSISEFRRISEEIRQGMIKARGTQNVPLTINDTICGQVSNRAPHLQKFAARHDVILFVCGNESSNGKVLYDICKSVNKNSYIISDKTEINKEWITSVKSVGICGATSTPKWLMEEVAKFISEQKFRN
jgi:4-hydroxy-3-methylbut-2-en-1-yl diphosphate reductase